MGLSQTIIAQQGVDIPPMQYLTEEIRMAMNTFAGKLLRLPKAIDITGWIPLHI